MMLDNMLGREPPHHTRLSKLVSMAFTPRRIDALRGRVESVCEELLRYTTPIEMTTPRVALEDVTFGSVTIPKGCLVSGVLGSANHDESQFALPERLDLGREPNKHLAFGFGRHFCLGASLARLEARIALTTLFRRWPALRLSQPAQALRWRPSGPLRGLQALPVTSG